MKNSTGNLEQPNSKGSTYKLCRADVYKRQRYHDGGDWIREVLHRYSAKNVIRTFEKMGLLCRSDREGRVYPHNLQ